MRFPAVESLRRPLGGRVGEALALLAFVAALGFVLLVYVLASRSDNDREAGQRAALRDAVEEARPVLGEFPSLEHQACNCSNARAA